MVVETTVKDAPTVLLKQNWHIPGPIICALVKVGGVPIIGAACVIAMLCPSKVIWAVRLEKEVLLAKEKLTTPLVMPLMVSHG